MMMNRDCDDTPMLRQYYIFVEELLVAAGLVVRISCD
jgi:hypothetical protein